MKSAASVFAWIVAAGSALTLIAAPASAQDVDTAISNTIECRKIANATERLACLDKAAEELSVTRFFIEDESQANGTAQSGAETPEQFGAEALPQERAKRAEKKLKKITAKIAEILIRPNKKITVTLDNGQIWRQLDGDTHILRFYGTGRQYTATIKRSVFGNYFMIVNELRRSARVQRIE